MIGPICILALIGLPSRDELTGTWSYRALSDKGDVAAEGTMTFRPATAKDIPREKDRAQWSHVGRRRVTTTDRGKFGPHDSEAHRRELGKTVKDVRDDLAIASSRGVTFRADLNWTWFDDNIYLDGKLNGSRTDGEWRWGTYAGYRAKGRFSMVKQPGRVH